MKKIGKYAKYGLYIIPLYGAIDQYKKPKGKRSKLGIIFSDVITVGFIIKIGLLYAGKVAATGDWHPFRFNPKEKIEKSAEKKNNLEKTINYYSPDINFSSKKFIN